MSDNYDDKDKLAKRMGFDSWEAFLNSETKDISEEDAKENYQSRKEIYFSSRNDFIITKEELERLNNFRSKINKVETNWSWLDDEENLEENIQNYISENNLEGKNIGKEDVAFYAAVHRRGLKYLLPKLPKVITKWSWLDDEEHLEENINNYISENNLEGKNIGKEDPNFYRAVLNRGLKDLLPKLPKVITKWSWLDDEENLEENINNYISENNLEGKKIQKEDFNFYNAVRRRGLKDLLPKIHINYDINNFSKEELKILQDQIYQRLSELEEE